MRSLVFVLVFSLGIGVVHAQSKKEMIVLLNSRLDSLNQAVANERSENTRLTTKIGQLEAAIKRLENEKSALEINLEAQQKLKDAQIKRILIKPHLKEKTSRIVAIIGLPFKTVIIGKQVWMMENLNVATFKNGVEISEAKDYDAWRKAAENQQPAWCYYDNDPKNGEKYGKLYNWYAVVDTNGLCPQGWHVPSYADWDTLVTYLGGKDVAGNKLKAKPLTKNIVEYYDVGGYDETIWKSCANCSHWTEKQKENFPCNVCKNTRGKSIKTGKFIPKSRKKTEHIETIGGWNGTNESGFTGLHGGYCSHYDDGSYVFGGNIGNWWDSYGYTSKSCCLWSSSENSSDDDWECALYNNLEGAYRSISTKGSGYSVRCLRD